MKKKRILKSKHAGEKLMQCGEEEKRQGRKRVAGEENMVGKEG